MTKARPDLKADLRADLTADLLADLTPVEPTPAVIEPEPVPAEPIDQTPVVSVQLTPMRWSRLKVVSVGAGKAVRIGPISVELNVKP